MTWQQRFPNDFTADDVAAMMEAHAQLVCRFPEMDPDTLGGMIVANFDDDKDARQIERDVARQIEQP
jgi:hypothetical protein